jgi:DNA polymerase-3 subunit delta'
MDKQKQSFSINNRIPDITTHPAYVWIGNETDLIEKAEQALQMALCPQKGCTQCRYCMQIINRQHGSLLWLCPEKGYSLDFIEPIFKTASFSLEENSHFFFVLQKADTLNLSCANALLKLIEEPPKNYHFIVLAERIQYILPTIRSRCLVTTWHSDNILKEHYISTFFKEGSIKDPITFLQKIESHPPNEHESMQLLDYLLDYWTRHYTTFLVNHDHQAIAQAKKIILYLTQALEKPPMPGSSKLLWKNLYLQFFIVDK